MKKKTYRIGHIFCGLGGKALGAQAAIAQHADTEATFETIGGIDFDPLACKDFTMLTGGPSLCADLHDLEPADLIAFFGATAPDVIMMSPPCKGFSGLLSAKRAAEPHYQHMNTLMERALFLVCSTWPIPPALVFVENVPRIASRGKAMVRRCIAMGEAHGYAVAEGTHDCGELGGLAQHRRRYFQLWRLRALMSQFVYQPPKLRVRACGEVLGPMPMPGDVETGGPMHSVPKLSWRNWLRLAMIPAGGDWRDLPGTLAEGEARRAKFRRAPVTSWDATAETVTGPGGSASASVADPRVSLPASAGRHWNKYAVHEWEAPALTVTGTDTRVGSGAPSIADPRFGNVDRVTDWAEPVGTITRSPAPSSGGGAVADPRWGGVTAWTATAPTVTSGAKIHSGAFQVADPRTWPPNTRYRVMTLAEALALDLNPDRPPGFIPIIVAEDGSWHRPLTTLELAALQSIPTVFNGKPLVLAGSSHTRWREGIGNAVPPKAAEAIANQLLSALLLSSLGTFTLNNNEIWVRPEERCAS